MAWSSADGRVGAGSQAPQHSAQVAGPRTGTPVDAPPAGGCRLTAREHEVARLVAHGLTNHEIADALVVSVRTAEAHVEHIRNKLGVRTRAEIAAWATREDLVADSRGK
jgi:non-specific serine/threonine protein kinase